MSRRRREVPPLSGQARKHLDAAIRHGAPFRPSICADCRRIVAWLRGMHLVESPLEITADEIDLVREAGDTLVRSYAWPKGTPDKKQPTQWHEGKRLLALADRLAAYAKRHRHAP